MRHFDDSLPILAGGNVGGTESRRRAEFIGHCLPLPLQNVRQYHSRAMPHEYTRYGGTYSTRGTGHDGYLAGKAGRFCKGRLARFVRWHLCDPTT